jgi:hypothetical protein
VKAGLSRRGPFADFVFDVGAGLTISLVCGGMLAGALYVLNRFLESSVQ